MDHAEYRRRLLEEPAVAMAAADMRAHAEACEACGAYTQAALAFEARLERALQVTWRTEASVNVLRPATRRPWAGWLALAASVLLGVGVATTLWTLSSERTLAAAVVAHMAEEPDAWRRTSDAVAEPQLDGVLAQSKLRLARTDGMVSYANACEFRGHRVPHLVVQSAAGPVTVMVLAHETALRRMRFDEGGYRGTIVPLPGHGSLAVLMQDPSNREAVDDIAARVAAALVWTR